MKLERSFYIRDTIIVAKELLGCFLVHRTPEGIIKGKIVEVEAYIGPEDKGSHSYTAGIHQQWIHYIKWEDLLIFSNCMAIITVLM